MTKVVTLRLGGPGFAQPLEPLSPAHCENQLCLAPSAPNAISLPLCHLSLSRAPHLSRFFVALFLFLFLSLSLSFRSSPLAACTSRLGGSCLNAQTKRRIKGTAGSASTAREAGERGESFRQKGVGNVYYYHRTRAGALPRRHRRRRRRCRSFSIQ